MKNDYLITARDQFKVAMGALVMAIKALEETKLPLEHTMRATKETIGDLAVAIEKINDHVNSPP